MLDVLITCLALNAYFEARNESREGQLAVIEVTLRRAEISGRKVCQEVFLDRQFSWTLADRPKVTNNKAWLKSLEIAEYGFNNDTNYSGGATHYHADYIKKPKWAHKLCETTRIGRHIFYKPCEIPTMMITDRQR